MRTVPGRCKRPNLASLSVTTPTSFAGAYLLTVTAAVVSGRRHDQNLVLGDNVEAYSPGSPIFAWSATTS